MILPSKHIKISESLLGLGAFILRDIRKEPLTIDQIWFKVNKQNVSKKAMAYHGFDNVILALNYLYIIGAIDINSEDKIYNATNTTESK